MAFAVFSDNLSRTFFDLLKKILTIINNTTILITAKYINFFYTFIIYNLYVYFFDNKKYTIYYTKLVTILN